MDTFTERQKIKTSDINTVYGKMISNGFYLHTTLFPLLRMLRDHPEPLSSPFYLQRFVYLATVEADKHYLYPTHGLQANYLGEEVGMLVYFHFLDELKEVKSKP